MFADDIIDFNSSLSFGKKLPAEIGIMNPFSNESTALYSEIFYKKYYSDNNKRVSIFGINPGRFGAGVTGIPFTDPVKLEKFCEIDNPFNKRVEASSDFIYDVIAKWGSVNDFYNKFYISSLSPLGFTKNGNNYNYYDSKELKELSLDFIIDSINKQLEFGLDREISFCLGKGTNYKIFNELNKQYKWFGEIVPLPHPRWVIQYNRKNYQFYIDFFINELSKSI